MVPLPAAWRRVLTWMRLAFAGGGLAGGLLLSPRSTPWAVATAGVYLLFSLVVPLRRRSGRAFALLELFVDLVYFLVLVGAGIGSIVWLPAFYFLYMLAEAVFVYGAAEVLIVVLVSAIFCIAVQSENVFPIRRTAVVMGALAYAFAVYKKRLEARMQELECEAGETREEAQRAREAERQRIASDFHDGPLQSFISLQMRLEILRKLLERDSGAGMDDLRGLQELAQQQVKELRAFVRSMRPPDMQGSNLYATARRICENFQKESGIPVSFVGGEGPLKFPEEMASEVIQMLREALHNVLKHAGATRVAVSLERVARTLELSVDDNGGGFRFSGVYSLDELELLRLGPASFQRRARALNAEMTLESRPGRGAGLKLRVPIP
ncbi:MAG TPA: sensor histidine kinase [Bryobacteraceae bacterium]|nr:sensor histidine kinase [Bryobacteraceae bacterium]